MERFLGFLAVFLVTLFSFFLFSSFSRFLVFSFFFSFLSIFFFFFSLSLSKGFCFHKVLLLSDTMGKRSFKTGKWVQGVRLGREGKGLGLR